MRTVGDAKRGAVEVRYQDLSAGHSTVEEFDEILAHEGLVHA